VNAAAVMTRLDLVAGDWNDALARIAASLAPQ